MRFELNPLAATFLSRPNRFLVIVQLKANKRIVHAHCPDPGRMRELLIPGVTVYVSEAATMNRKTGYDLRFVVHPQTGCLVSIDSQLPNRIFAEGLQNGTVPPLSDYALVRTEASSPEIEGAGRTRSRFDFLLRDDNDVNVWVEVKSATLVEERVALFPDAKTERGRRHVLELAALKARTDARAAIVFIVQRSDADILRPQRTIDPDFADAMYTAVAQGVETYAFVCNVTLESVSIDRPIQVVVSATD